MLPWWSVFCAIGGSNGNCTKSIYLFCPRHDQLLGSSTFDRTGLERSNYSVSVECTQKCQTPWELNGFAEGGQCVEWGGGRPSNSYGVLLFGAVVDTVGTLCLPSVGIVPTVPYQKFIPFWESRLVVKCMATVTLNAWLPSCTNCMGMVYRDDMAW